MPIFQASTQLDAPVDAVASFHHDTIALKRLTPPPVFVQLHALEPLAEGSLADFTLWFGPLPIRWLAKHAQVSRNSGFTDTQVRGPMRKWVHTHRWRPLDERHTLLEDHIAYEHKPGWQGLLTRLLFAPPLLKMMFAYRHAVTRRALRRSP
jgi:ligand-binding SRPBCC domain-containing protein